MNPRFLTIFIVTLALLTACTSAPAVPPTQSADAISTLAFQQVYIMLTQTALAVSPTPSATPTIKATPPPKKPTSAGVTPKRSVTTAFAPCWKGPGPTYTLISNISPKKYVDLLGIGNVPGWYVVRNPYFHNPCWIEAIYLKIDPNMDTSKYPVMTPSP